jgi:hypothetical protein
MLQINIEERSNQHLLILYYSLNELNFFKELSASTEGRLIAKECCRYLNVRNLKSGDFVMREKEKADNFYIIL